MARAGTGLLLAGALGIGILAATAKKKAPKPPPGPPVPPPTPTPGPFPPGPPPAPTEPLSTRQGCANAWAHHLAVQADTETNPAALDALATLWGGEAGACYAGKAAAIRSGVGGEVSCYGYLYPVLQQSFASVEDPDSLDALSLSAQAAGRSDIAECFADLAAAARADAAQEAKERAEEAYDEYQRQKAEEAAAKDAAKAQDAKNRADEAYEEYQRQKAAEQAAKDAARERGEDVA